MMGEEGMHVGYMSRKVLTIREEMRKALRNAMRALVPDLLGDCDDMNTSVSRCTGYDWSAI